MSEPIKVGDLVMVVRLSPCGCGILGAVFKVMAITENIGNGIRCAVCNKVARGKFMVAHIDAQVSHTNVVDMFRLKRIDPPAIGDSLPTRKDMKEPA